MYGKHSQKGLCCWNLQVDLCNAHMPHFLCVLCSNEKLWTFACECRSRNSLHDLVLHVTWLMWLLQSNVRRDLYICVCVCEYVRVRVCVCVCVNALSRIMALVNSCNTRSCWRHRNAWCYRGCWQKENWGGRGRRWEQWQQMVSAKVVEEFTRYYLWSCLQEAKHSLFWSRGPSTRGTRVTS